MSLRPFELSIKNVVTAVDRPYDGRYVSTVEVIGVLKSALDADGEHERMLVLRQAYKEVTNQ